MKHGMTDSNPHHDSTWGAFTPLMPSFIRLLAGVIVLVIVEAVILGFPGIQQTVSGTSFTVASLIVLFIGLVVSFIVLRFGLQFSNIAWETYKAYRAWTPLLAYVFQLLAIVILYWATSGIVIPYFASTPWVVPLLFLLAALIPTLKVVVNLVHALEGHPTSQHS